MRQGFVELLSEIMDIMAAWECSLIDFYHRAYQNDLPVRMGIRNFRDQFRVDSLIYHSIIAKPGPWNLVMRRVSIIAVACLFEVNDIDAARKTMHIRVAFALGLIEAGTAGKHKVGDLE